MDDYKKDEQLYIWDIEDDNDEEMRELQEEILDRKRRLGWIGKFTVVIVLLAFLIVSLPDLSFLWSGELDFLQENSSLSDDRIVQDAKPAVVSIKAISPVNLSSENKMGTAFNINSDGLLLTNRHVVNEARQVEVSFSDGQKFFSQDINEFEKVDAAVVKIDGHNLPYLILDFEDEVKEGDIVTVIGNPLGFERVSGRGKVGAYYRDKEMDFIFFSISAVVKSGSSGSPVLNEEGRVVGIVFASGEIDINGEKQEYALAIPVKQLQSQLQVYQGDDSGDIFASL